MRFFPREKGKRPLSRVLFEKAVFPFSRGKIASCRGLENRGSLISVPSDPTRPLQESPSGPKFHAQYDWTTGVPDNGNEWRKFPCFVHCLIGVETEGLLDYQGRAGDHFHCTVEPSPGHIRCREIPEESPKECPGAPRPGVQKASEKNHNKGKLQRDQYRPHLRNWAQDGHNTGETKPLK